MKPKLNILIEIYHEFGHVWSVIRIHERSIVFKHADTYFLIMKGVSYQSSFGQSWNLWINFNSR